MASLVSFCPTSALVLCLHSFSSSLTFLLPLSTTRCLALMPGCHLISLPFSRSLFVLLKKKLEAGSGALWNGGEICKK